VLHDRAPLAACARYLASCVVTRCSRVLMCGCAAIQSYAQHSQASSLLATAHCQPLAHVLASSGVGMIAPHKAAAICTVLAGEIWALAVDPAEENVLYGSAGSELHAFRVATAGVH
jgi:hypothetical protein